MLNSNLIEKLQATHPTLCRVFKAHSQKSIKEFSEKLFKYSSKKIEPELLNAFAEEWREMDLPPIIIQKAMDQLGKMPVLQTGHHITPTNGPTFLALDLISCSGLKADQLYIVAANSGVAFSNTAWSGCLSFGSTRIDDLLNPDHPGYNQALKSIAERKHRGTPEKRISLIPSSQRDQLVFGSVISEATISRFDGLSKRMSEIILKPEVGVSYSYWAAKTCSAIQKRILNKNNLLIFDVNEVVRRYLVKVLSSDRAHPIKQLFFEKSVRENIQFTFKNPVLFLSTYKGKKSHKVDTLTWEDSGLFSPKSGLVIKTRDELLKGLETKQLCPGVFLVFLILKFINGFRCLGSFNQLEYIENYRQKWLQLQLGWDLQLHADSTHSLTTGRLIIDDHEIWPLDLAINGESISEENYVDMIMEELWEPILNQLTAD